MSSRPLIPPCVPFATWRYERIDASTCTPILDLSIYYGFCRLPAVCYYYAFAPARPFRVGAHAKKAGTADKKIAVPAFLHPCFGNYRGTSFLPVFGALAAAAAAIAAVCRCAAAVILAAAVAVACVVCVVSAAAAISAAEQNQNQNDNPAVIQSSEPVTIASHCVYPPFQFSIPVYCVRSNAVPTFQTQIFSFGASLVSPQRLPAVRRTARIP